MLKEFKAFITKGNVMDMAVGVIIGSAFSKIVTSLVNDIFSPVLGLLTKNADFSELSLTLRPAVTEMVDGAETVVTEAVLLKYGAFIQNIIDFLLIAVCVFLFVKVVSTIRKKAEELTKKQEEEKKAAEPPKPSNEEVLLTEIRDLLKNK